MRQNFDRLRRCYDEGLRRDRSLKGRITAKFEIDRVGAAHGAFADPSATDLPDPKVVACAVHVLGKLSFPAPESPTVSVVFPLSFSRD